MSRRRTRAKSRLNTTIERLEMRCLMASDLVWHNPYWDPSAAAGDMPDLKGADAYYYSNSKPIGMELHARRFVVGQNDTTPSLPADLTLVRNLGTSAAVYESTNDLTPEFIAQIGNVPGVAYTAPLYVVQDTQSEAALLNEVIVALKPGETAEAFFARSPQFSKYRPLAGTPDQFIATVGAGYGRAALDVGNATSSDPAVQWVAPNFYQNWQRFYTPNDPRFGNQWHLNNTGQGGGLVDADSDLPEAWNIVQGGSANIIVGVIDDGVQSTHPDLRVWTNPGEIANDNIDNDGNGWVDDIHGWNFVFDTKQTEPLGTDMHGTSVSGVATAAGDNNLGVAGSAYNSQVIAIKMFDGNSVAADADIAGALYYAAGRNKSGTGTWRAADLVNNSWGGGADTPVINAALSWGTVSGRQGQGATYFFATGNGFSSSVSQPAAQSLNIPGVIAIGATNNKGERSNYSNYGSAVDVVTPSNDTRAGYLAIDTTDRTGANGYAAGDYTGTGATGFGGTSSATPLASGIGALVLDRANTLGVAITPTQLRGLIRNSTDLIGGAVYDINSGKNIEFGYGRLNAYTAVSGVNTAEISVVDTTKEFTTGDTIDFGALLVGQSTDVTLRIRNQGTLPLDLTSITVPAPFSIVNLGSNKLNVGEATTFTARYRPTAPGAFNVAALINSNDVDESTYVLNFTGTATAPAIGGSIWEDYNGDGVFSSFEDYAVPLGAFAYLDIDQSDTFTPGDQQVPIVNGSYAFLSVPNGTYTVRTELPGWTLTAPSSGEYTVTITSGADYFVGLDFGYSKHDRLYARVFEDLNSNGNIEPAELGMPGFKVSAGTSLVTVTNNTPTAIIDAGTVISTLNVTDIGKIGDLNVKVNIDHTWMSDIWLKLKAPDGTEITLVNGAGGADAGFIDTVFDDSATTSIYAGTFPFTGSFVPDQPLSTFNLKSMTGIWTLTITDTVAFDSGTVNNWSLEFTKEYAGVSDTNGYALVDLPAGTNDAVLQLAGGWLYTLPSNGTHTITSSGAPVYGLNYGIYLPNVAPTSVALSNNSVLENEPVGTFVGSFSSVDPNRIDSHTYSLVPGPGSNDNSRFSIVGNQLVTNAVFDFELKNSYTIRVRSTDAGGLFINRIFTISILNVNEAPSAITLAGHTIEENRPVGTPIGTLLTADLDGGGVFTYTLVPGTGDADNAFFAIAGGQLLSNAVFDFETRDTYSIRVRSTDQDGLFVETAFQVLILDVNESATTLVLTGNLLPENKPAGFPVGIFSNNDPDIADVITYELVDGVGSEGNIMFQIVGDALQSSVTFDYEARTSYPIRVRVHDRLGLSIESTFTVQITNVNEAPNVLTINSSVVPENRPAGELVGDLIGSDPDAGATLTYALVAGAGGGDNGSFTLVGTQLRTNGIFDFEAKGVYNIRVRATDEFGATFEQPIEIAVVNENEAPTNIAVTPAIINESRPVGTLVGLLSAVDPDFSNFYLFELVSGSGSTDNASFSISGNQLKSAAVFDYDVKNSYSIRVRATDLGGLSSEAVLNVSIANVNEQSSDILISSNAINENRSIGTTVGILSTVDPDSTDTFTYQLVSGTGGSNNSSFVIVGNELRTTNTFDFEIKNTYSIRVRSTDSGGDVIEKPMTIIVSDINEAPVAINLSSQSVDENVPVGTTVAVLSADDPDSGDTFTYSLVGGIGSNDNAQFQIAGNTLRTASSINFEAKSQYLIRIRATDAAGLTRETPFVISAINVNEAPFGLQINGNFDENQNQSVFLGSFTASDVDNNDALRYEFVSGAGDTDNTAFTMHQSLNGTFQSVTGLDFETKSSYNVRVRATDLNGMYEEKAFVINVINKNDAPTDLSISSSTIAENTVGSPLVIGTLSTTDQDTSDTFTYSLVSGAGSTDNASFAIVGNEVRSLTSFNFENKSTYNLRVRSVDSAGSAIEKAIVVTVTDVNEAPTLLSLSGNTLAEDTALGAALGTLTTLDPDVGDVFTYSLVSGVGSDDNAVFTIQGANVQLASKLNFEAKPFHTIRVRTTDAGGISIENVFLVNVTNVNEAPKTITISRSNIDEEQAAGSLVGTLTGTDDDAGDVITFSLVSGALDNSMFSIVGNQVRANSTFNYESKNSYTIRVRATDSSQLSLDQQFVIAVNNVNEAPSSLQLSANTISENLDAGAAVGALTSIELDANDPTTYTLVSGAGSTNNAQFVIVGNQLKTAGRFDFETQSSYSVRIRATDVAGLFTESAFTISVLNVSEAPASLTLSASTLAENQPIGTLVGQLNTVDPDGETAFTYRLVAGPGSLDNASFSIVGDKIVANGSFNFEAQKNYAIRVRSIDSTGLFTESPFTISVTNVNEAPTSLNLNNESVLENKPAGTVVGNLLAFDPDAGDTFTFSLVSGDGAPDNAKFEIVGNELRTRQKFNYEAANSFGILVRATDAGGLTRDIPMVVSVVDVSEVPPVASVDTAKTSFGRTAIIDVLGNDTDADGTIDPTTVTIITPPSIGTVKVLADGRIEYSQNSATTQSVTFEYNVRDNDGEISNFSLVTVNIYSAFQNQRIALDVDADGSITPLDVLVVVNDLNANSSRALPTNVPDTAPYIDTDGDGFVGPLDVLRVVNFLNSRSSGGEGEFVGPIAASTTEESTSTDRVATVDQVFADADSLAYFATSLEEYLQNTRNKRR